MQEEVTQKTIALSMKTGKLTAQALQAALKKYLQHRAKGPKLHHGKQSLKQLKAHGAALTNIEVTEANIGAFKPCAKKYGVDFTLRKDKTTQPPHYIVIFKAKDTGQILRLPTGYIMSTFYYKLLHLKSLRYFLPFPSGYIVKAFFHYSHARYTNTLRFPNTAPVRQIVCRCTPA